MSSYSFRPVILLPLARSFSSRCEFLRRWLRDRRRIVGRRGEDDVLPDGRRERDVIVGEIIQRA